MTSTRTLVTLLCPWIRSFTIVISVWWFLTSCKFTYEEVKSQPQSLENGQLLSGCEVLQRIAEPPWLSRYRSKNKVHQIGRICVIENSTFATRANFFFCFNALLFFFTFVSSLLSRVYGSASVWCRNAETQQDEVLIKITLNLVNSQVLCFLWKEKWLVISLQYYSIVKAQTILYIQSISKIIFTFDEVFKQKCGHLSECTPWEQGLRDKIFRSYKDWYRAPPSLSPPPPHPKRYQVSLLLSRFIAIQDPHYDCIIWKGDNGNICMI